MKTTYKTKRNLLGLLAVAGIGLLGGASASAWGPERATFTMDSPATYPVFNSITDNPTIGDERDFVRVGEIHADVTSMKNEINVIPGKQYLVYIYFHNNASATFNDSAHNNSGVATGARVSTLFPTILTAGQKGKVSATITANNTNPLSVWDEAYMTTSTGKVLLSYVEGSAKIYNDWQANDSIMPSTMFTEGGALIGLNTLNGIIPGCEEYHGVITYVVEAKELSGDIDKVVSKDGKNFKENVEVKAGEEVTFKLTVKNTGDVKLSNATVKDSLPAGMSLVPGSVQLWANESNTKETISDDIVKNGINLGTIGTGNTVYITYRAKASENFKCKGTNLVNTVRLTYDSDKTTGDYVEDTSKVVVTKENCEDERKKPGFEIDKKASLDGQNWVDDIKIKPGDTVSFKITYKNTGNVVNHGVIVKDVLDSANGMELVADSVEITRSTEGSDGVGGAIMAIVLGEGESVFDADGALIGDVSAGEIITVSYKVKFTAEYDKCEITKLFNNASVSGTPEGANEATIVNDSVEIQVDRTDEDCNPVPEEYPNTGPVEIAMAIAIALGIGGGGYYFYRTKKSLKTIEGTAAGKDVATPEIKPEEPKIDMK